MATSMGSLLIKISKNLILKTKDMNTENVKSENSKLPILDVRQRSTSWWNGLSIRTKWDLFYKYNPMIANAPSNIGLNLNDIEKSHIDEIWQSENVA